MLSIVFEVTEINSARIEKLPAYAIHFPVFPASLTNDRFIARFCDGSSEPLSLAMSIHLPSIEKSPKFVVLSFWTQDSQIKSVIYVEQFLHFASVYFINFWDRP